MRKIYSLLIGIMLFTGIKAQVNYSFSAITGTYTDLVGGTSPTFSTVTGYTATDEGYANAVPIGFTFNYNGSNVTTVNIMANGFVSLGAALGDNDGYYTNNLSSGPSVQAGTRPIIAPLWDDYDFASTANITYLTTGSAPNRVFTVQWKNVLWNYNATTPSISFQLKLYETTNVIEFVYNQEAGTTTSPGASIGITAATTGAGNFMSVQDAAGSSVSTSTSANTIATKPATGQVFRFTPLSCVPPTVNVTGLTNNSVNFSWTAVPGATSGYEYAVTTSATPPASGTATSGTTGSASSLSANTVYYIHIRSNCGTFSPWNSTPVSTTCSPFPGGYTENFNSVTPPAIPACFRIEDVNNDGTTWVTGAGNGTTIPTNNLRYAWSVPNAANDWIFLGPFTLSTGFTYNVAFKYKASNGPTYVEKLEVKYGTAPFASAMTSAAIFSNTNINTALADPYADASAPFSVTSNGNYYIGFRVFSDADQAILHIDDITVNGGNLPVTLSSFTGRTEGSANILDWITKTESNNKGFELQRSADGKNFTAIAFTASKAENGNSTAQLDYQHVDVRPLSGTNYYRLRQIDLDGKFSYSNIVTLKSMISDIRISSVYPNPTRDELNLIISAPSAQKATIVVTDLTGKVITQQSTQLMIGDNQQQLNLQSLSAGTYLVKLVCDNGCETAVQRFVKY